MMRSVTMKRLKSSDKNRISVAWREQNEPTDKHQIDPGCPICQVDIGVKSPEGVKEGHAVTSCGHIFGSVCIKRYLSITDKPLCPVCRNDLFHNCSHPILPVTFNPQKSNLSAKGIAQDAFPAEPRQTDCGFCRNLKIKAAKRQRVQEMLEATRPGSGSDEYSDDESTGSPSRTQKGLRLALHIFNIGTALARLTLDAAHIRKIKALHPEEDDDGSAESSNFEDYENGDLEGDVTAPPHRHSAYLPVPGAYGHWDLANRGPDWKFLAWYDSQEPKMNTTPDHFS